MIIFSKEVADKMENLKLNLQLQTLTRSNSPRLIEKSLWETLFSLLSGLVVYYRNKFNVKTTKYDHSFNKKCVHCCIDIYCAVYYE